MKFSTFRITDHRPARPCESTPQSPTGLDQWKHIEMEMQSQHDRAVRTYSHDTATSALQDLAKRPTTDNRSPEHRWIRHRRAALHRKLFAPERRCEARRRERTPALNGGVARRRLYKLVIHLTKYEIKR